MVDAAFDAGLDTTSPRRATLDTESAACGELARRVARCSGTVASHTPRRVLGLRVDRVIAATAWAVLAGLITFGLVAGATAQTQANQEHSSQHGAARATARIGHAPIAAVHPSGAASGQRAPRGGLLPDGGLPDQGASASKDYAAEPGAGSRRTRGAHTPAQPGATPGPAITTSPDADGSGAAFEPSQAGPRDAAGASGGTVLPGSGGTAHRDASLVMGRGPSSAWGPAPLAAAGVAGSQWAALFAFGLITVVGLVTLPITWRWAVKAVRRVAATIAPRKPA